MDKEPTQEQRKEFWERCGFEYGLHLVQHKTMPYKITGWKSPDGSWLSEGFPPIDLNNLFRYALPKFLEEYGEGRTLGLLVDWVRAIVQQNLWGEEAPALFWALRQVKEDK